MEEVRSSDNLEPVRCKKILITEKRCCVPNCKHSSRTLPAHLFFLVPRSNLRFQVYDAIQAGTGVRPTCTSIASAVYICECHYELDADVEFWEKCNPKTNSTPYPVRLKKGVLPHIFPNPVVKESLLPIAASTNLQTTFETPTSTMVATTQLAATDKKDAGSAMKHKNAHKIRSPSNIERSPKNECGCKESRHSRHKTRLDSPLSVSSQNTENTSSPEKCVQDVDYIPSASSFSSTNTDLEAFDVSCLKSQIRTLNMRLCLENSKAFLGIDENKLSILKVLQKHIIRQENERDIIIVLRKIKLNESFQILSLYFGLSISQISRVFDEVLPIMSKCFRTLIFKPSSENLHLNLPAAFRSNYFAVTDIIDAFEVETEKPSDPVNQALTWSEYKHCNTFKFLISCTPDGQINYVSKAFGGRVSDSLLAIECGFVVGLKEKSTVLADRGFKHLDSDLAAKNCTLLRPPSISSDEVLTEEQSLLTKQVAALRIHVERVIGRIRDFALLSPHARVDHNLSGKLDEIVTVAAGLVNLQSKITRF